MKNPELYQKTVDILVQAYFDDTLMHGDCAACAVGNIVAANTGCLLVFKETGNEFIWIKNRKVVDPKWDEVFCSVTTINDIYTHQQYDTREYHGEAKEQIDSTGYTVEELALIERSFENVEKGATDDEYMFNGLMSVIDTLNIIHRVTDSQQIAATKQRFVKAA